MNRLVRISTISLLALQLFFTPLSSAVTITPQPTSTYAEPAIVITSFGGNKILDFAELYNQTASPVYLRHWQVRFTIDDAGASETQPKLELSVPLPDSWLLPKHYVSLERNAAPNASTVSYAFDDASTLAGMVSPRLSELSLVNDRQQVITNVVIPVEANTETQWSQHKQRTRSGLSMSGVYATDYATRTVPPALYSDQLYVPPADTSGLSVVEILANARDCSPIDVSLACTDYVKLQNTSSGTIDLSLFRLRSDSGGAKASSSNTFPLSGELAAGDYITVHAKSSGDPMSLTNTGGYVWLEDAYGAVVYEPLRSYPDASLEAQKGKSWALDHSDGVWKWMLPAPEGPNYWPPAVDSGEQIPTAVPAISDCGPGKERNPDTNRCRALASTAATLVPCPATQVRNPDTNRCRSTLSAGTSYVGCRPGQERNPDTNRCRSVLAAATILTPCKSDEFRNPETNRCKKKASELTALKACPVGQERNPDTNRCRNAVKKKSEIANVKDVTTSSASESQNWILAGAIAAAAVSYGVYEWRDDILQRVRLLKRQ